MEPAEDLSTRASELLEEARRFQLAAAQPGGLGAVPETLASLEEALQVLSAARAAGRAGERRHGHEFPRFQRHDRPDQRVA